MAWTLRVASLRHTLAVKALAGRAKDIPDMQVLAKLLEVEEGGA